ncbi:MAG TPA: HlyD family efflux transporter periplasmic adaptor subunit [Thermoanaerobaculia bacterium]|nr:HlyD family efflux transporter periplasmic adaptor subunit [Thermoanaerobaculia bacterium]
MRGERASTCPTPRSERRIASRNASAVAVFLCCLAIGCSDSQPEIPTFVVVKGSFERRVTAEGNLKAAKATPLTAPSDAPGPLKIAWLAADGIRVSGGDVVARFDPIDFENQLQSGREDDLTANNKSKKQSVEASATKDNLRRDATTADDELETARRFRATQLEIFSRWEQIESELDEDLAAEKRRYALEVLGVRDQLAAADLALLGIEERKARLKIRNAERGLSALSIEAPHDGVLVLQKDWRGEVPRVGATVWTGSPLGEIPNVEAMEAEVFVLEADAAGLAVDQKATVWLESDRSVAHPAKVIRVDKLARPRFRGVPVQYFGVTLQMEKTDTDRMKPGTRVRALLDIEAQKNALSIPRQALFEKQGKRIVYRRNGSKFEPVAVQITSSSAGRVVVSRGLIEGDVIALEDPTESRGDDSTATAASVVAKATD